MFVMALNASARQYPVVVVGTGFGSLFFVHRLLESGHPGPVLMLERGAFRSWKQQVAEGRNSNWHPAETFIVSGTPKPWNFTIGYGGGTNCWYATTPRLHPNDFRLKSFYGRGQDWPVSYNTLEPYYTIAEEIMDISGPEDLSIIGPRSRPYPQPPPSRTGISDYPPRVRGSPTSNGQNVARVFTATFVPSVRSSLH